MINFYYQNFNSVYNTWDPAMANAFRMFSDANRVVTLNGTSGGAMTAISLISKTIDKTYCEVLVQNIVGGGIPGIGIVESGYNASLPLGDAHGWSYQSNARRRNNNTNNTYGNTYTIGDVIGIATDIQSSYGFIYFSLNGVWQNSGVPTSGATGTGAAYGSLTNKTLWVACGIAAAGAATFKILATPQSLIYAPPTGYSPGIKL